MTLNSADILKEGPRNSDLLAVKLAKRWYAVCMNTGKYEQFSNRRIATRKLFLDDIAIYCLRCDGQARARPIGYHYIAYRRLADDNGSGRMGRARV